MQFPEFGLDSARSEVLSFEQRRSVRISLCPRSLGKTAAASPGRLKSGEEGVLNGCALETVFRRGPAGRLSPTSKFAPHFGTLPVYRRARVDSARFSPKKALNPTPTGALPQRRVENPGNIEGTPGGAEPEPEPEENDKIFLLIWTCRNSRAYPEEVVGNEELTSAERLCRGAAELPKRNPKISRRRFSSISSTPPRRRRDVFKARAGRP